MVPHTIIIIITYTPLLFLHGLPSLTALYLFSVLPFLAWRARPHIYTRYLPHCPIYLHYVYSHCAHSSDVIMLLMMCCTWPNVFLLPSSVGSFGRLRIVPTTLLPTYLPCIAFFTIDVAGGACIVPCCVCRIVVMCSADDGFAFIPCWYYDKQAVLRYHIRTVADRTWCQFLYIFVHLFAVHLLYLFLLLPFCCRFCCRTSFAVHLAGTCCSSTASSASSDSFLILLHI